MTDLESARQMLIAEADADEVSFSAGGLATSALVAGRGRSLLLLHGLNAAGSLVWWPVFPGLSEEYRVFAPDLPGLGASEALDARPDASRVVEWLSGVMDECCEDPVILVATSLAGGFALSFAAAHPDRLRGLILTDAQGLAPFRPPPGFMIATLLNSLRPSRTAMRRLVRYVIHDQAHVRRVHGTLWDAFLGYMVAQAGRREVGQAMRGYASRANSRPVAEASLAGIDMPVGMVWGRHDQPFPLSVAEDTNERFGWPLTIIEKAGHLPYIEQPSRFVHAVSALASRA